MIVPTNNDLQNIQIKLKIEQHELHSKPGVNSGAAKGYAVPTPLVTPVMVISYLFYLFFRLSTNLVILTKQTAHYVGKLPDQTPDTALFHLCGVWSFLCTDYFGKIGYYTSTERKLLIVVSMEHQTCCK
jgi:hypothetical protein